jgi:hypothetical protein
VWVQVDCSTRCLREECLGLSLKGGAEEVCGELYGLGVNGVAIDSFAVGAKEWRVLAADIGTGIQEDVVAYVAREDVQLRSGNIRGEIFGTGSDGNILVRLARNNLYGNGDFLEARGRKRGAERRRDSEDRTDARVAIGIAGVLRRFRVLLNPFAKIFGEGWELWRTAADSVGLGHNGGGMCSHR